MQSNFGEHFGQPTPTATPQHLRTQRLQLDIFTFFTATVLSRIFYFQGLGRSLRKPPGDYRHAKKSNHGAVDTSTARWLQPSNCWHIRPGSSCDLLRPPQLHIRKGQHVPLPVVLAADQVAPRVAKLLVHERSRARQIETCLVYCTFKTWDPPKNDTKL